MVECTSKEASGYLETHCTRHKAHEVKHTNRVQLRSTIYNMKERIQWTKSRQRTRKAQRESQDVR